MQTKISLMEKHKGSAFDLLPAELLRAILSEVDIYWWAVARLTCSLWREVYAGLRRRPLWVHVSCAFASEPMFEWAEGIGLDILAMSWYHNKGGEMITKAVEFGNPLVVFRLRAKLKKGLRACDYRLVGKMGHLPLLKELNLSQRGSARHRRWLRGEDGHTHAHKVVIGAAEGGRLEVLRWLRGMGFEDAGVYAFEQAVEGRHLDVLLFLIDKMDGLDNWNATFKFGIFVDKRVDHIEWLFANGFDMAPMMRYFRTNPGAPRCVQAERRLFELGAHKSPVYGKSSNTLKNHPRFLANA